MTQINYHDKLREKIMEDSECRENLYNKPTFKDYILNNENTLWKAKGKYELNINHILHFCNNKWLVVIIGFWEFVIKNKNDEEVFIKIDFLKSLSEQQEACKQILEFLNK